MVCLVEAADDYVRVDFDDVVVAQDLYSLAPDVVVAVIDVYPVLVGLLRGVCQLHFVRVRHFHQCVVLFIPTGQLGIPN